MAKIVLHKDYLKNELDLPCEAIKNAIVDVSRWSVQHEIIFACNGKFYKTWYSSGATEQQYEYPWDNEEDIECCEVELKEVMVAKWVNVEDGK